MNQCLLENFLPKRQCVTKRPQDISEISNRIFLYICKGLNSNFIIFIL